MTASPVTIPDATIVPELSDVDSLAMTPVEATPPDPGVAYRLDR
jgi:hypothetical protein